MTAAVLLAALLVSVCLGFALLALSQDRHWHHSGGTRNCPPRAVLPLRTAGFGALLVALALALVRDGPSFGALLWATCLTLGALAVVAVLTWRPYWMRPLVRLVQLVS